MSTVRAAFNISATIVKSLVKVAGFGFVADAIEGGQELYQLACSLKDETFGSAEAQMSGALGRVQLSVYPSFCLKGLMHDE